MIGKMKHRLTLQEKSTTLDNGGGLEYTWVNVTSTPHVYAEIEPLRSGLSVTGGDKLPVTQYKITIRYRSDVTHEMRLIDGAHVYNIISVVPHATENTFLDIWAEKQGT